MPVIETVRYRVKSGVTPESAIQAWEQSQSFARAQKGFLSRRIAVSDDGEFIDMVEWQTMDDAKRASDQFNPGEFPDLMPLIEVLDESTMVMTHYEVKGWT